MTTPARNAQTAALEALIEPHAIELERPTVWRRFSIGRRAWRESGVQARRAERWWRPRWPNAPSAATKRRLMNARFPQIKRLERFHVADSSTGPTSHYRRARRRIMDR